MKAIIVSTPAPACILRSGDPARCHDDIPLEETFARHTLPPVGDIRDDYQRVQDDDYLSAPGGFRY